MSLNRKRQHLRLQAKTALAPYIHGPNKSSIYTATEPSPFQAGHLIASLFNLEDNKALIDVHNGLTDSTYMDQVLKAIANHGNTAFLAYWYTRRKTNDPA